LKLRCSEGEWRREGGERESGEEMATLTTHAVSYSWDPLLRGCPIRIGLAQVQISAVLHEVMNGSRGLLDLG
jgi:hypothetical protein